MKMMENHKPRNEIEIIYSRLQISMLIKPTVSTVSSLHSQLTKSKLRRALGGENRVFKSKVYNYSTQGVG